MESIQNEPAEHQITIVVLVCLCVVSARVERIAELQVDGRNQQHIAGSNLQGFFEEKYS